MGATPSIDTARVTGRRQLTFNTLADVLADVEMLAHAKQIRHLGNWPPGQVLDHLARVMHGSIDGFPQRPPRVIRFFLRLLFKKRFLTRPMSAGFNLPKHMEADMVPAPVP